MHFHEDGHFYTTKLPNGDIHKAAKGRPTCTSVPRILDPAEQEQFLQEEQPLEQSQQRNEPSDGDDTVGSTTSSRLSIKRGFINPDEYISMKQPKCSSIDYNNEVIIIFLSLNLMYFPASLNKKLIFLDKS